MTENTDQILHELGYEVKKLEYKIEDLKFDQSYNTQIKPVTVAPKTPNVPQGRDTFQTPNYAVDLLVPFIPKNIKNIWECAAGEGKIAQRLSEYGSWVGYKNRLDGEGFHIFTTDIRQSSLGRNTIYNFINGGELPFVVRQWILASEPFAIITNPPFSIKEEFIEKAFGYKVPFAFLINADYSGKQIDWIRRGCEKIIPNRRIDYITPTGRNGKTSSSQFHSMWLTYGFNIGRTETFVELSLKDKKENI